MQQFAQLKRRRRRGVEEEEEEEAGTKKKKRETFKNCFSRWIIFFSINVNFPIFGSMGCGVFTKYKNGQNPRGKFELLTDTWMNWMTWIAASTLDYDLIKIMIWLLF